jgi:hypothetical protein
MIELTEASTLTLEVKVSCLLMPLDDKVSEGEHKLWEVLVRQISGGKSVLILSLTLL